MTDIIDMKKLAEVCDEDDRFCVVCLRSRTDVPVIGHCCYQCGGGDVTKETLH